MIKPGTTTRIHYGIRIKMVLQEASDTYLFAHLLLIIILIIIIAQQFRRCHSALRVTARAHNIVQTFFRRRYYLTVTIGNWDQVVLEWGDSVSHSDVIWHELGPTTANACLPGWSRMRGTTRSEYAADHRLAHELIINMSQMWDGPSPWSALYPLCIIIMFVSHWHIFLYAAF